MARQVFLPHAYPFLEQKAAENIQAFPGVYELFIRDIGQVVPILLQFGFWFTPVVYLANIIPEKYRGLLALNPMYHLVGGFQDTLVFHKNPSWIGVSIAAIVSALLLSLALFMFRKASAEMADEL